jgi:hypothetical protein
MNISKLALIALLGGALMAFGCSSDSGTTAGSGGSAGTGGTAGGGGDGGMGGAGGEPIACVELPGTCANGDIDAIEETCMLAEAPDADVCDGTESLENPATCSTTGTVVTHQLSLMQILGDCNAGYDLDSCAGNSCQLGGLAPGEGEGGVDNALAGLAPVLVNVGGNLGGVNQAFHDALCSGDLDLALAVDANLDEGCANVDLVVDGETAGSVILNVGTVVDGAVCASGSLGTIPIVIVGDSGDPVAGTMANAVLRATIVPDTGFGNGVLGGTVDSTTAAGIADALIDGGSAVVAQVLDINDDLSGDVATACNALSLTLDVGGVVVEEQ